MEGWRQRKLCHVAVQSLSVGDPSFVIRHGGNRHRFLGLQNQSQRGDGQTFSCKHVTRDNAGVDEGVNLTSTMTILGAPRS